MAVIVYINMCDCFLTHKAAPCFLTADKAVREQQRASKKRKKETQNIPVYFFPCAEEGKETHTQKKML